MADRRTTIRPGRNNDNATMAAQVSPVMAAFSAAE
jgi:hypothetical protein